MRLVSSAPPSQVETTLDTETPDGEGVQPWPAAPPPGPPARIGHHAVVRELGRGRMGVVYQALDPQGRPVAIKVLRAGSAATAALEARFLFEACTLLRLAHPSIVRAYEIGRHAGGLFYVMDHIDGPTLAQRLRSDPPDLVTSLRIVAAVARAIHHVHEQGLVHRDVKPRNIVLAQGVEPRIIDFGIAMALDQRSAHQDGRILGTRGYMAPEQAEGRLQAIGPAADIYALGAVLHHLLTGSAPHESPAPAAITPGLPAAVARICHRALARDPAHRHASALELARALERCLHEAMRHRARALRRVAADGDNRGS